MKSVALKIAGLSSIVIVFLCLFLGVGIVVNIIVDSDSSINVYDSALRQGFDQETRHQVETAVSLLKAVHSRIEAGDLDAETGKKMAADLLRELRYGEEGYFWADTYDGVNVVLLGRPAEGQNRIEAKDARGNEFIKMIIKAGLSGGGYTEYWFPKMQDGEPLPKRSYSLAFEPFGWVIGTGAYIDTIDALAMERRQAMLRERLPRLTVVSLSLLASIAISFFASLLLARRIARPIVAMHRSLRQIASGSGDLTARLAITSKDEVGEASRSFNEFVQTLSTMLASIRSAAGHLSEIGGDLAANLVESAGAVNQITANIESMRARVENQSAGVTETASAIDQIAANLETLNRRIEEQSTSVTESSAAIEEMVANIGSMTRNVEHVEKEYRELIRVSDNGKTRINEVARRVAAIEGQSASLMEANSVISSIASQTNLLAMNAAIEAAHAGDAGRGFSVVADEIRKLAESAATQSKQVKSNIAAIRDSIEAVVSDSKFAETAFDETLDMIKRIDALQSELKAAMMEQEEGSKQILEALTSINTVTAEVRDGSAQMTGSSSAIRTEISALLGETQEIRQGMQEITAGTAEINTSLNEIASLGSRNKEYIDAVLAQTARFTLD